MKSPSRNLAPGLALIASLLMQSPAKAADYPVSPVPFTDVQFTAGMLHDRQQTNVRVTLPFALGQLETSKRLGNFDLAAETMRRRGAGEKNFQNNPPTEYPFDDTDVYKAVEGAAFCLSVQPDPVLQKKLEDIIARVAAAQEPDGYIYTFRTMHPDSPAHKWVGLQRWEKDPDLSHELYNLGHLYESGVAYKQATGSDSLLDICLKSAELLQRDFGDGQPRIAPGHEVVEMGLAKLYRETGDERWLNLAKFFLECRGGGKAYSQNHQPVTQQREAVGHAVRANYLYSGMADVAALKGDPAYIEAITALWDNVAAKKLHLTGGCGALAAGEAYGANYELPNRCYNETCAAIAFLYWTHRMFLLTGEAKYMDVFERTLYNGFLSGVSLSGDKFFYPNTLEYDGKEKNNHGFAGRAPWFGCACCPPNLLRALASLSGYMYATQGDKIFVNLYGESVASIDLKGQTVKIDQRTKYPWDGKVALVVSTAKPQTFDLDLRIPGWVQGKPVPTDLYRYDDATPAAWSIKVNGASVRPALSNGYATIHRAWQSGDTVELDLPMPVRRVAGNAAIAATRGMVALERGPVVYAFEGIDNGGSVFDLVLPASARITPSFDQALLGGVEILTVDGAQRVTAEKGGKRAVKSTRATAVPYAWWNNRGLSPMAVWLPRDARDARPTAPASAASKAKVSVSFARDGMDARRLNDGQAPRNATDGFAANFDFWPHKGTTEWAAYEFEKPQKVSGSTVWWFSDEGRGECRAPRAWRLLYQDISGSWKPVPGKPDYAVRTDAAVSVKFSPVTAKAMRLEVDLPDGFSSGVYEWDVDAQDAN